MAHPVLEQQTALEAGPMMSAPSDTENMPNLSMVGEFGSKAVSNTVAAMVAGAVITLIALRAAGFRFSFGVNVGGGA